MAYYLALENDKDACIVKADHLDQEYLTYNDTNCTVFLYKIADSSIKSSLNESDIKAIIAETMNYYYESESHNYQSAIEDLLEEFNLDKFSYVSYGEAFANKLTIDYEIKDLKDSKYKDLEFVSSKG